MARVIVKLAPHHTLRESAFMSDPTPLVEANLYLYHDVGPFGVELVGEAAAEELFDLTNNPSREKDRAVIYGDGRSVSVGDVIDVDGVMYLCKSVGWKKLSPPINQVQQH